MIFVVDSSNRDRLDESQGELVKLVHEKELKDASLLIFANKQVSYCIPDPPENCHFTVLKLPET